MINKNHIEKIELLRGIAIIGVCLYHLQSAIFPYYQIVDFNGLFLDFQHKNYIKSFLNVIPIRFGDSGVALFFIISGFLIHLGYLKNKRFNLKEFYAKRFFRIYPPYLFFFLFFLLVNLPHEKINNENILLHLLLIHNYFPKYIWSVNASFWSLAIEMQFYLVYPILLIVLKKFDVTKTFFVNVIISILLYATNLKNQSIITNVLEFFFINYSVWLAGALLAEKFINNKRVFRIGFKTILFILFLAYFLCFTKIGFPFRGQLSAFFWFIFVDWYLHEGLKLNSIIWLKSKKLLSFVGLGSFSLYLMHQPILDFVIKLVIIFQSTILSIIVGVFLLIVLTGLAYLSYLYIEKPSINLRKLVFKESQTKEL